MPSKIELFVGKADKMVNGMFQFSDQFHFLKFNTVDYCVLFKMYMLGMGTENKALLISHIHKQFYFPYKLMQDTMDKLEKEKMIIAVSGKKNGCHTTRRHNRKVYYLSKNAMNIISEVLNLEANL